MRCLLSGAAVDERFVLEFPDFDVDFDGLVGDDGDDGIRVMLDTADTLHCTTGVKTLSTSTFVTAVIPTCN